MVIGFDDLVRMTNRYNNDLLPGEVKMNLTEMAGIMSVKCPEVDLTHYDSCLDGTGCRECAGKSCMSVFM